MEKFARKVPSAPRASGTHTAACTRGWFWTTPHVHPAQSINLQHDKLQEAGVRAGIVSPTTRPASLVRRGRTAVRGHMTVIAARHTAHPVRRNHAFVGGHTIGI